MVKQTNSFTDTNPVSFFCLADGCDALTNSDYTSIGQSFQLEQDSCLDNCDWLALDYSNLDPADCTTPQICNWDEDLCAPYDHSVDGIFAS
jgi:hypothetical protein